MSLTHRPAENPAQPSRPHVGEPSPFAPKWAREGGVRPRKVIPLRQPSAPQIVPAPSAAPPGGPEVAAAPRVSGPDLLAQDAVFKQLLGAAPDPQPPAVQPVRDPVGLALGVIARLIVAGCAAAAIAMLLVGAIPLPWRLGAPATSKTAALPAAAAPAAAADVNEDLKTSVKINMAAPAVKDTSRAGDTGANAGAPPVRVATVSVRPPQAGAADRWALDPDEVARLVKRGQDYLAQGDIAAARLILGRATEAQNAQAALSLGATYDPAVLRGLHVLGFKPDVAQARTWYEKAAEYGSTEAAQRLAALPRLEQ